MKKKSLGYTFPECFKQEADVRHIATIFFRGDFKYNLNRI